MLNLSGAGGVRNRGDHMAYASVEDVQARMTRLMPEDEQTVCSNLLEDAAAFIDSVNKNAEDYIKKLVSCRMVMRALGDGSVSGVPIGATQGSMSGLGYAQSWTVSTGGSTGELYMSKADKLLLGAGNKIGSHSPLEDMTYGGCRDEGHDDPISG